MKNISLEELLEAGCHFGHQVSRQNPKARDYIFDSRDNIHIIDLEKTKEGLDDAAFYVKNLAKNGGTILVLGTKRQAQEVLSEAIKTFRDETTDGIYWVTKRWIGGTFTNLQEVSKNFRKLKELETNLMDPSARERFTKREIGEWEKEKEKLKGYYGGVVSMTKVPDAIFVIDTHIEDQAVREALSMNVKTIGITDTNSDPTIIDYPIPANDDAVGSIQLITQYLIEAWREGKKMREVGISSAKTTEGKDEEKKVEKKEEEKPSSASTSAKASADKKASAGKEESGDEKKEVKKEADKESKVKKGTKEKESKKKTASKKKEGK
jgi:small subunit ribosomal protein S2